MTRLIKISQLSKVQISQFTSSGFNFIKKFNESASEISSTQDIRFTQDVVGDAGNYHRSTGNINFSQRTNLIQISGSNNLLNDQFPRSQFVLSAHKNNYDVQNSEKSSEGSFGNYHDSLGFDKEYSPEECFLYDQKVPSAASAVCTGKLALISLAFRF